MVNQDRGKRVALQPRGEFQKRSGRPLNALPALLLSTLFGLAIVSALPVQAQAQASQTASGQQGDRGQLQAVKQQAHQGRMPTRFNVTAANELIGRTVVDSQGQDAGEIEYLMLDTASGAVQYAIIGSGGFLGIGEELIAVPWSVIDYGRQTIRIDTDRTTLERAPRYTEDRLSELTRPLAATTVIDYYRVTERQSEQPVQPQQSQQTGQAQQGQQAQRRAQAEQGTQQGQQAPQRQPSQQAQQQAQDGRPHILIARDYFTLLAPPAFMSVDDLQGLEVVGASGEDVGDIDQVMIDPDHGYVAYVLLGQGGFLGIGEEWLAIPFTALEWSHSDGRFRLNATEAQLQGMTLLSQRELPTRVRASQLEQLYNRFGETPYWQKVARMRAQSAGGRQLQQAAMTATVQDINQQQRRLTLRTMDGETLELQVSADLLSNLQAGDTVEVSIQPSQEARQSGQSGKSQSDRRPSQ